MLSWSPGSLVMLPSKALSSDDFAPSEFLHRLLVRLARTCPRCRSALLGGSREEPLDHLLSHVLLASGPGLSPSSADLEVRPDSPLTLPRDAPPSGRPPSGLRSTAARGLLGAARSSVTSDPARAAHAAGLASRILDPPESPEEARLHLAAHLHRADALREDGAVAEAGRLLDERIEEILLLDAPAWRGDLHLLAARIRQAQERPDEALLHLRLARADYRAVGDEGRLVRALLRTASVLRSAAELPRAIAVASEALELAAASPDGSLRLAAHHNLAAYLIDAGLDDEAREILGAVLDLYPTSSDSPGLLHYLWLSARLAASAGDRETAVATYRKIRSRFLTRGEHHHAALVTAELAHLHLQASDTAPCEEALRSLGPILREAPEARESPELRRLLARLEDDTTLPPALLEELTSLLRALDP